MEAILKRAFLLDYASVFDKAGYDDLEFLCRQSEKSLRDILEDDIEMKKGHIRKFWESLKEFKSGVKNIDESQSARESKTFTLLDILILNDL